MHDVLSNPESLTIDCLDHGFVRLVDVMPREVTDQGDKTADGAIVQAARVSYGEGTKTINEDRGLIRYLMRHSHTTPLEMVEFKFHCKMPIFVARQWIRHRTANVNEVSARYTEMKDEFFIPEELRKQSATNKQGSDGGFRRVDELSYIGRIENVSKECYNAYGHMITAGVAKELARVVLPVNLYTEWYWKIDLHNLLHFLALRCDSHAQHQIRVFADAMLSLITPIVPLAIEAWEDYHPMRGGMRLSRQEVESLSKLLLFARPKLNCDNQREVAEFEAKLVRMEGMKTS